MYKKILLPTDGSDNSLKAAERVIELQKAFGSKIVIFHSEKHYFIQEETTRPLGFPFMDFTQFSDLSKESQYLQMHEQFKQWGQNMLFKTAEIFKKANIEVETRLITEISPENYAETIVKEEKFDLVVVGCKGHHSALRKLLIGTVAEKISNNVDCDVLIVR
jgi:nucleotide-binding universal stress UspA family protein